MNASVALERRPPLWWVLIRHEWRLTVRAFLAGKARLDATGKRLGKARGRWRIGIWIVMAILFHVLALILTFVLPRHLADDPTTRLASTLVMAFLFTLMLSSAMSRVVAAFHERHDLELLLAAPIAPALILVIRALTVVAAVTLTFAIFLYPFADVGVVMGRWWAGRLYPLVPLMALLTTAVALTLTGAVVRLIGVRRARVGLQIFSALVGASFYLVSQARQFLPRDATLWTTDRMMRIAHDAHPIWPVAFATRIAIGDGWTWLAFTIASVALFAASVRLASRRFFEVAQQPEADGRVTVPKRSAVEGRIGSGFAHGLFATLLVKEWRLILRAPQLISQILLQLLYLMPLMFVAFGQRQGALQWSAGRVRGRHRRCHEHARDLARLAHRGRGGRARPARRQPEGTADDRRGEADSGCVAADRVADAGVDRHRAPLAGRRDHDLRARIARLPQRRDPDGRDAVVRQAQRLPATSSRTRLHRARRGVPVPAVGGGGRARGPGTVDRRGDRDVVRARRAGGLSAARAAPRRRRRSLTAVVDGGR